MARSSERPPERPLDFSSESGDSAVGLAMVAKGALGVALAETLTGASLATRGNPGFDLAVAVAGFSGVVSAELRTLRDLGLHENIEDILISSETSYYLITLPDPTGSVFMMLVLDRAKASVAEGRYHLREAAAALRR